MQWANKKKYCFIALLLYLLYSVDLELICNISEVWQMSKYHLFFTQTSVSRHLGCFHIFSSVHFNRSVMSDSLRPHELPHATPPCPSPTPRVHPNPCPLSQWCHPTISSSVVPFSSCPQSFPASGSFPMSQLFTSGGQSIGVSASASVLQMNTQDCFPLGWTGWISLQSKDSKESSPTPQFKKHQFFCAQLSL